MLEAVTHYLFATLFFSGGFLFGAAWKGMFKNDY